MSTIDELLAESLRAWPRGEGAPPRREARLLLAHALGLSEGELLARGERAVPSAAALRFRDWVARRRAGEPVAYLLGRREFFGLDFRVDARVLVPRPETELLVEAALALPLPRHAFVVDVGTGSGAIAVALATRRTGWRILALDRSLAALAVARANAARLVPHGDVALLAADRTSAVDLARCDLLISNPPYVALADRGRLPRDVVDFEPAGALFAGADGLDLVRDLAHAAAELPAGAWGVLEIGEHQAPAVVALFARAPEFSRIELRLDLAGLARVVIFQRGGSISHRGP